MRTPFKLALASWFFSLLPLSAQEEQGYAFLNIVNLIPGKIPADVTIGGKSLMPDGLTPGSATGWFMVPTGEMAISVSLEQPPEVQPRIRKVTTQLPLIDGVSSVIVIYLQPEPLPKPDGTPSPPRIRLHAFPAFDGRGFALNFVSVCPELRRFQIGPNPIEAKPLEAVEIPNWAGGAFEIMHNGESIGNVAGSTEKGSFYLFVATNEAGEYIHVLTRAGTQSAPPWRKVEKEKNQP
jgi:hypothetical protein